MIFGNLSGWIALSSVLDVDQSVATEEMYSSHERKRALYPSSNTYSPIWANPLGRKLRASKPEDRNELFR